MTGDILEHHRHYVGDHVAQVLYRKAIHKVVRPGDTVLDLGSGTGLHAIEACRAGASKVYAVEWGDIAVLAREIVAHTPFRDRIDVIQENSAFVRLPRKVDVIITYLGPSDLVHSLTPARARFLKRGGHTLPNRLRFWVGPVHSSSTYADRVASWRTRDGFPWHMVRRAAANTYHAALWRPTHFLAPAQAAFTIPFDGRTREHWTGRPSFTARRAGILHGLGLWYETCLAPGIWLSTRPPLRVSHAVHKHAFLPLERPIKVRAGTPLKVRIDLASGAEWIWRWQVDTAGHASGQSTLDGLLISPEHLKTSQSTSRRRLSVRGELTRKVLEWCHQGWNIERISLALARSHKGIFPAQSDAFRFVQGTLASMADPLPTGP